jgi:hypothetical protein
MPSWLMNKKPVAFRPRLAAGLALFCNSMLSTIFHKCQLKFAESKPVGRESEAHPAISIIPYLDFERLR